MNREKLATAGLIGLVLALGTIASVVPPLLAYVCGILSTFFAFLAIVVWVKP